MYVADHPRLTARSQRQTITLDRAYADRNQLEAALELLLGGEIKHLVVLQLDLVADTTMVDVRFKAARSAAAHERHIPLLRSAESPSPAVPSPTAIEGGAP
jgi:hypothetical protein